jgi:SWI/SNF-related matrix-associated actin-dependent regulator 1 of chromatin subfamily A
VIAKLQMGIECEFHNSEDYAVTVTGDTHVADRGAAVTAFQGDKRCRVFIGSIGAAGVGITLTAASHVIFCELDPVPGKMSQAEDRAHRIGQKNSVLVQHLVMDRTLCARMAKIVVRKQAIIKEALDG